MPSSRATSARNVTDKECDPAQRFRLYRVCQGETTKELVATCASSEALGVALVTLGREGEFLDCAVGILDTAGEVGEKWILKPWRALPREVSAAASVLARSKKPHIRLTTDI